jgi:cytochrome P450
MNDFLQDKKEELRSGARQKEGMDIMGELVRAKYGASKEGAWMTDANIIGNAFVMFVAGHETTGNTLHFTMLELANNPAAQRQLQRDIDRILGRDTNPSTWDYEGKLNAMLSSYLGACMNETLRMIPPVVEIPKYVTPGSDQVVVLQDRKHTLSAETYININAVASGRNPRCWPTKPSKISGAATDLNDYIPERWYRSSSQVSSNTANQSGDPEEDNFDLYDGQNAGASLFRPARGSYLPFSVGPRSCLGQRIAQVELIAALAVIFQKYSVELAVDEWATDEEVEKMGLAEKQALYARAQAKGRETIRQADSLLTLKLNGGKHVPVRVVRRGKERFMRDVDT